ncbi:esterase family protein [Paenibacillus alginolyticus]|uniref:alpha/beta hydrolase n=1 Tax=Paenibacillus alginolyticus TaxID=59839 RepID=UPI00042406B6|nr:alpha/beta hydrolase-fold protein [Paenibacillus alginolyticus]MCY9666495.1 esterase family protein [Paenibacillus alginolyticus]
MKVRFRYKFFTLPALIVVIILVINGFSFKSIAQELYSPRIIDLSIYSDSLQKDQTVEVYLPPGYSNEKTYPVLYLLHGKDGNMKSWFNGFFGISGAKINQTADRLIKKQSIKPMIIVSPQIDNSYGVNTSMQARHFKDHDEGMYEDFLTKELVPYIESQFHTERNREGRFIGGISMGGFAALHAAISHPDLFSKAGGHSAALRLQPGDGSGIDWLFNGRNRDQLDPLYQVDHMVSTNISVFLDHGDHDHSWLSEGNEIMFQRLTQKKVKVTYTIGKGGHDYRYWSSQTETYLKFYSS